MSCSISLGSCSLIRQGLFLCDPQVHVRVRFGFALWCEGWRLYLYPPLEASPLLVFIDKFSYDMRRRFVVRDLSKVFCCVHFSSFGTHSSHALLIHFFVPDV